MDQAVCSDECSPLCRWISKNSIRQTCCVIAGDVEVAAMTTLLFQIVDPAGEQARYSDEELLRAITCLRRLELARELALPDDVRMSLHRSVSEPGPHDAYIWEAAACWAMPLAVQRSDFAAPYLD